MRGGPVKNFKKSAFLFLIIFVLTQTHAFANNPGQKLVRSFKNILWSPVEIATQYHYLNHEYGNPIAILSTPVYSVLGMGTRILGGALELVTFPFPYPDEYGPLLEPPTPIEAYHTAMEDGTIFEDSLHGPVTQ
jgi:putative exosortase-associated protein (TIGR04073 family)